jgi:CelD/BcsL family acetyltransferase involved in cellulose biosynthesis
LRGSTETSLSVEGGVCAIEVRLERLPEPAKLGELWRKLEARSDASFFLSWHWIGCWLATIATRPWLLVARYGEQVVGLALLSLAVVRRHRILRVPTLYLNQTGDEGQDVITIEYNDILADRTLAPAVRQACLEHLLATERLDGQRIDAIAWRGAEESVLERLAGIKLSWRLIAEAPSAAVDLAAIRASGRPFLAHVSANTRRQIRRAMALYEERHGPLRLEAARDVEEGLRFFHAAGELHQARWVPRGKPGAFAIPFYIRFHERLIREALPEEAVELVRVTAGEEPIGYLYNFLYRGRVYYYFSGFGYVASDNRLRPGLVSHTLCIERHLAREMEVYDFMAGDSRYKTNLAHAGARMVGIVIERPKLPLRAEAAIRSMKSVLHQMLARSCQLNTLVH